MSKNKEIATVVEFGEYKGSPTLGIYELDDKGEKKPYPFSFGKKKAQLIMKHLKEIEEFANNE